MRILACLLSLSWLCACTGGERRSEAKIEAAVAEQLAARREVLWRQCRLEAVERASDTADSLLLVRAHTAYLEEMKAPPRPDRPDIPIPEVEPDSTPLVPLLPEKRR